MRTFANLLTLNAAAASIASAQDALIYTFDTQPQSSTPKNRLIPSRDADLLLSSRLGSSAQRPLGAADDSLLDNLNAFGGLQPELFGKANPVPRLLNSLKQFRKFTYQTSVYQIGETSPGMKEIAPLILTSHPPPPLERMLRLVAYRCSNSTKASFNINLSPTDSSTAQTLFKTLYSQLHSLAASGAIESTLIFFPTTTTSSTIPSKFTQPNLLSPRSLPLARQNNSTSPPSKNLQRCYPTASNCTTFTNSCSGHGKCTLSFIDHSASSGSDKECYSCTCHRTVVRENADGTTKSVLWGGHACQKKDVSFEFWMFALFGVALTAVVSWGVGMLFELGSEELPSVLGAGVAGPRAQR
ncbi:MAG: hypothetical protein Q9227_005371 [Pyrenula ochraceoflavens]